MIAIPRLGNHDVLVRYANRRSAQTYLEIGVCAGFSMYHVLTNSDVRFAIGIDTWGNEAGGHGVGNPKAVIELLGSLMDRVALITGNSHAVLPMLAGSFDMIFVDGDHSAEGCVLDMDHALRLLAPGGVVLVDDLDNPSHPYLRRVVDGFVFTHGLDACYHDGHCGVAALRRKLQ